MSRQRDSRRLAAKLLLLLSSLLVCLLLAEAWLRLSPQRDSGDLRDGREKPRFNPFVASAVFGFELRPHWSCRHQGLDFDVAVTTNSLGQRGAERSAEKPKGAYRILVLGDSVGFGYGVEDRETLPAQLEDALRGKLGRDVEVLNAGVPGWSADQHYLRLATTGLALEPDLVIVLVIDNDPEDLMWHRLALGDDRLPERVSSTRRMIDYSGRMRYVNEEGLPLPRIDLPGGTWLASHFQLYHVLRYRIARLWLGRQLRKGSAARSIDPGPGPLGAMTSLSASQIQHGLETSAAFRMRYHRFLVEAIDATATDRGVPVRWLRIINAGPDPAAQTLSAQLDGDCDQRPSRCLNMRQVLPLKGRESYFLPVDRHPNPEGYARMAAATARWLQVDPTLGLAPPTR